MTENQTELLHSLANRWYDDINVSKLNLCVFNTLMKLPVGFALKQQCIEDQDCSVGTIKFLVYSFHG